MFTLLLSLFILCFLLISGYAQSQILTPSGTINIVSSSAAITQTSDTTDFMRDTIPANYFAIPNHPYSFEIHCSLNTPAAGIPMIMLIFKVGGVRFVVTSSALTVGSVTNGSLIIRGTLLSKANGSLYMEVLPEQPYGTVVNMLNNNSAGNAIITTDLTQPIPVSAGFKFGGIGLGTSYLACQYYQITKL